MVCRGGRTQRCHGVVDIKLCQCDDIHIAFNDQDVLELAHGFTRFIQAIEFLSLVKYRGLRAIEVLGGAVVEYPAAKSDGAPAPVMDGKLHTVAKAIIAAIAAIAFYQQTQFQQYFLRGRVRAKCLCQVVPAGRCKADIKAGGDLTAEAPVFQVVHQAACLRVCAQLLLVILGDLFKQFVMGLRDSAAV